jgi:hypothetical protein
VVFARNKIGGDLQMSDDEFEFLGLDKKELLGVGNLAGHYANNKKLDSTNERLKDIQGRGAECPHCGGNLAHNKVNTCKHCGRAVVVDYGIAYTLQQIQALRAARKKADEEVQKLLTSISVVEYEQVQLHRYGRTASGLKSKNPESVSQLYDRAIKIMEKVLDLDEVKRLKEKKESHFKRIKKKASDGRKADKIRRDKKREAAELEQRVKEREGNEKQYGKAQLKKEEDREGIAALPMVLSVCYGLYAIPCWLLSLLGFEPWFWNSISTTIHYSLMFGGWVLTLILFGYVSFKAGRERKAILHEEESESESKSESDNQKKAKKPTKKEDAQKQSQPVAYYLKRGETIRGPLERAAVHQAAKGRKLMTGDQIANYKDGPWQDVTKEQLQQIQQGNDVKIRWLVPPQDRESLKKWLRSIGDQPSVSCPYCDISIKRSNLLKHCDKLHPINAS